MGDSRAVTDGGSRDSREESREGEGRTDDRPPEDQRGREPAREGPAEWFATSAVRVGLAIVALVLLLFAIGRITNTNILEEISEVLESQVVVWLIVAVFALLLLGLAARGFSRRQRSR